MRHFRPWDCNPNKIKHNIKHAHKGRLRSTHNCASNLRSIFCPADGSPFLRRRCHRGRELTHDAPCPHPLGPPGPLCPLTAQTTTSITVHYGEWIGAGACIISWCFNTSSVQEMAITDSTTYSEFLAPVRVHPDDQSPTANITVEVPGPVRFCTKDNVVSHMMLSTLPWHATGLLVEPSGATLVAAFLGNNKELCVMTGDWIPATAGCRPVGPTLCLGLLYFFCLPCIIQSFVSDRCRRER